MNSRTPGPSAAVYGLTEHARAEVDAARLVANPGCYPTSILLPLLPLLAETRDVGVHAAGDDKRGLGHAACGIDEHAAHGSGSHGRGAASFRLATANSSGKTRFMFDN